MLSILSMVALTLSSVLSAPFASGLAAAPAGAKVAWLENEQGKRNVYVASAPDWKAHRVTNFNKDDGQEIGELTWSPNATFLVFTRGGDLENGLENPNPAIAPTRPDQEIWYAAADGSALKKLTDGHAATISPHGDLIAFIRGGQIFSMFPSGEEIKNIIAQKGVQSGLQWSPDGNRLAFVSRREEHSFIGVYDPGAKSLRYLDASVDKDIEPVWSPDSKRLAYLRLPAQAPRIGPGPRRTGEPWSIRISELETGSAREIFRASEGVGSVFHEITAPHQIFWTSSNLLVFPWERTGWCHLYRVPANGGSAVELTPGEGEVEQAALSHDGSTLYASSNIGDIDGRHLWSVNPEKAGTAKQFTSGENLDLAPGPLADESSLAFLSSSYREKTHAMIRSADGKTRTLAPELVPSEFPSTALVKPQLVVISAADGLAIHAQLFLPPSGTADRHPALVFFHGGSRRQMLPGFHYMYYYSNAFAMNEYLASQGYVVLSVNYRSGIGYGMRFREAINYGAEGGSEFNDVIGAGLYLKNRPDVDPARIGVWGGSYGGYLTAMALARASNLFGAGVDFHGVHDWSTLRETPAPTGGDPKTQREFQEALRIAFESSPMASIDTWKSPVLLIHGDDDRNVSFDQTVMLVEALRHRHVEFEQLIFPNEIHDFLRNDHWLAAYQAAADFFSRKLHRVETTAMVR